MKIKNIFLTALVSGAAALSVSSCDFLDTTPHDFTAPETFYSNEEECRMALAGVYMSLAGDGAYANEFGVLMTNSDDLSYYGRTNKSDYVPNNSHTESTETIWKAWLEFYTGINNANVLIENIGNASIDDEATRNAILGEARFLRAYYHFLLAQSWYNVPLRKESVKDITKAMAEPVPHLEALDWIITEMEDALPLVDDSKYDKSSSHVKKTVVEGILARVYLWKAGYNNFKAPEDPELDAAAVTECYTKALAHAQAVKDSGKHALVSTAEHPENIYLLWKKLANDEYETVSNECMWEVEFTGNREDGSYSYGKIGSILGNLQNVDAKSPLGYSYGYFRASAYLWSLYEEGDLRKDLSIAPYTLVEDKKTHEVRKVDIAGPTDRCCGKYRREWETKFTVKSKNYTACNYPLLRYADVLLMIAQAENELNGPTAAAHEALNMVRTRANVAALSGLDKAAMTVAIQEERARELCFESIRRFDLVRWGMYTSQITETLQKFIDEGKWSKNTTAAAEEFISQTSKDGKHTFYPIPSNERSVNTLLPQNPFWN